jgi:hypothetical protein
MDAMKTYKIAVLDDYQNVPLESADWSVLGHRADSTVFRATSPIRRPRLGDCCLLMLFV